MHRLAIRTKHFRSRNEDGAPDGGASIKNGELLSLVSAQFDVFLTVDRNLSFQQNLPAVAIAVIVLKARSKRLADLQPLVPELLSRIPVAPVGTVTYVGF